MFSIDWGVLSSATQKFRPLKQGRPLTYRECLSHWQHNEAFRRFFSELLADSQFEAFRFETPSITKATLERGFEYVLVDAPEFSRRASDPQAFGDYFRDDADAGDGVVVIDNLGKDTRLVVPVPQAADSAYGHLAAFVRQAPEMQQHAFWRRVAQAVNERLSNEPLWLNTAGDGVPWLHLRLDSRPNYYAYAPYRSQPRSAV